MRKLHSLLLVLIFVLIGEITYSQCIATYQYVTVNAPSPGNTNSISTCNIQNDYDPITGVVVGREYVLNANVSVFATITDPAGNVVNSGMTPHSFIAPSSGTFRVHWFGNSSCGLTPGCVITSITCLAPPPPNPTAASVSDSTICQGTSVDLSATGITGTADWYSGSCGGTFVGTGNPLTVSPTDTTTYYVKNVDNGVSSTNCQSVTVYVAEAGLTNTATIVDESCHSSAIGFTGDGEISITTTVSAGGAASPPPYSYAWSNGSTAGTGTTSTINGLAVGTYTVTVTDGTGECSITESFTVNEPTALSTSSSVVQPSCNGLSDGSATLTFNGGANPDYTYTWPSTLSGTTGPGTSVTESSIPAGSYTVTVTDNNNCEFQPTITVGQPNSLANTVIVTDALCNENDEGTYGFINQTITGGTQPYEYDWSNGDTVQDLDNVFAGIYQVTVTDANGCVFVAAPDTIEGPSEMIITQDQVTNLSCFENNSGIIAVSTVGGTQLPTYIDSVITDAVTVVTTTNEETPMGSDIEDNKNQFVYPAVELQAAGFVAGEIRSLGFEVVSPSPDTLHDFKIALKLNTGATNFSMGATNPGWETGFTNVYSGDYVAQAGWNVFEITPFIWDGTSDVIVQTCFNNDQVINPMSSSVTAMNTPDYFTAYGSSPNYYGDPCANESFDGVSMVRPILYLKIVENNYAYNYNWSTGSQDSMVTSLAVGTYTVIVSDLNNCLDYDTITLTEPAQLQSSVVGTDLDCNGDNSGSAAVTATGGNSPYTYAWSSGGTNATETGLAAGTYMVTITDDSNCTVVAETIIDEPISLVANVVDQEDVRCEGDETGMISVEAFGGTPSYTYNWSDGSTDSTIENVANGSYTVTITDANGCTEVLTTVIDAVNPLPTVDLGPDQTLGAGTVLTLDAGSFVNYMWNNDMDHIWQTFSWVIEGDTTFVVEVVDANGCTNTDTININAVLGTNEMANTMDVRYYPNPTAGLVYVEFSDLKGENVKVEVVNVQGQQVLQQQFNQAVNGRAYQLDLTGQAKGVYFVKLTTETKSSIHKVTLR